MTVQSITHSAASPKSADLASDIDELFKLRAQAAEIDKRARVLRDRICAAMAQAGIGASRSAQGRFASITTSVRWQADYPAACRLLPPELVDCIFRATRSVTLRVK